MLQTSGRVDKSSQKQDSYKSTERILGATVGLLSILVAAFSLSFMVAEGAFGTVRAAFQVLSMLFAALVVGCGITAFLAYRDLPKPGRPVIHLLFQALLLSTTSIPVVMYGVRLIAPRFFPEY